MCFYSFTDYTVWVKCFCPVWRRCVRRGLEPLRRSQPAGHSSLVINVYWHYIDTLRSQFLVCEWKMLLECRSKWGVGEYPPCTSFPSVFRGPTVYCWVLSVLFVFHCLTVFFLPTLNCTRQDILFWNGTNRRALINRLCCFYGINSVLSLCWNTVRAHSLRAVKKNNPKVDHNIIYSWKTRFFLKLTYRVTWYFTLTRFHTRNPEIQAGCDPKCVSFELSLGSMDSCVVFSLFKLVLLIRFCWVFCCDVHRSSCQS